MTRDPHGPAGEYPYSAPKLEDRALWALLLAIFGWMICPIVAHILALVLASQSLAAIRRSGGWLRGEGMAAAARIIAIIGLTLSLLAVVAALIALIAFVAV